MIKWTSDAVIACSFVLPSACIAFECSHVHTHNAQCTLLKIQRFEQEHAAITMILYRTRSELVLLTTADNDASQAVACVQLTDITCLPVAHSVKTTM